MAKDRWLNGREIERVMWGFFLLLGHWNESSPWNWRKAGVVECWPILWIVMVRGLPWWWWCLLMALAKFADEVLYLSVERGLVREEIVPLWSEGVCTETPLFCCARWWSLWFITFCGLRQWDTEKLRGEEKMWRFWQNVEIILLMKIKGLLCGIF